ncbi:MAG: 3-deoxy-manno-octulosonate cytidylyltransferase [Capsulimonadaceae bacterium]
MPEPRNTILGVIPARLNSTRLPGKALLEIAGRPMIHWVYLNARRSDLLTDLIVATDSPEIEGSCKSAGIPVLMTGEHPSGSDRLYEVLTRTAADIYVNIQGDEPTVQPAHIALLLGPLLERGDARVSTLKVRISATEASNPNCVKVVTTLDGRALYFSRHAIPYDRDGAGGAVYYKHIGLYAYTREALDLFHRLPQTPLELTEKLEQLRYLENGIPIDVVETARDTVGVDTQADLERVIALFETGAAA